MTRDLSGQICWQEWIWKPHYTVWEVGAYGGEWILTHWSHLLPVELKECLLSFCAGFMSFGFLSKNIKIKINTTIILLLFSTGLKLGLTVKEVHRLRMFENRVLRNMFGPMRDEVTAEWKRLHNEELCDLFSTPNIIQAIKWRMRRMGHVALWGRG